MTVRTEVLQGRPTLKITCSVEEIGDAVSGVFGLFEDGSRFPAFAFDGTVGRDLETYLDAYVLVAFGNDNIEVGGSLRSTRFIVVRNAWQRATLSHNCTWDIKMTLQVLDNGLLGNLSQPVYIRAAGDSANPDLPLFDVHRQLLRVTEVLANGALCQYSRRALIGADSTKNQQDHYVPGKLADDRLRQQVTAIEVQTSGCQLTADWQRLELVDPLLLTPFVFHCPGWKQNIIELIDSLQHFPTEIREDNQVL